jgi:hypothetical protein
VESSSRFFSRTCIISTLCSILSILYDKKCCHVVAKAGWYDTMDPLQVQSCNTKAKQPPLLGPKWKPPSCLETCSLPFTNGCAVACRSWFCCAKAYAQELFWCKYLWMELQTVF